MVSQYSELMVSKYGSKPHQQYWGPPPNEEQVFNAAIATAQFAVMSPDLFDAYRRELLDNVLWLVTAAPSGKYTTRFRSHAAVTNPNAELRHEHVYTRRSLIKRMLDDPGYIEKVVRELAIGCVVTKAEHKRLSQFDKSHEGWETLPGCRHRGPRYGSRRLRPDSKRSRVLGDGQSRLRPGFNPAASYRKCG